MKNCIISEADVGVFFRGALTSGLIEGCILSNNENDAIRIYRSSNLISIINNTISHNNAYYCHGIYLMNTYAENPVPPKIVNNIISHNSGYGISEDTPNDVSAVLKYNLFFNNTYGDLS
jgi:hypothetical protein